MNLVGLKIEGLQILLSSESYIVILAVYVLSIELLTSLAMRGDQYGKKEAVCICTLPTSSYLPEPLLTADALGVCKL
ncbi:hypothetical protein SynSYN20_01191 [Synechococcus sp. SYN20]|nr:hypothetical protein SynSYN20_01191 [Synechococcus sp. SYN20]